MNETRILGRGNRFADRESTVYRFMGALTNGLNLSPPTRN